MSIVLSHIVILDGQARIEGKTHLKAEMVARMYLDGDYTIEEVMAHYDLTPAEVYAALTYYYDHQAQLDATHSATLTEIQTNAMTLGKLQAKLAARRNTESSS